MDWFEEWFDSSLYEKLYANRDQKEARQLVELLEKKLALHTCSHILDLGCGRGRHAINLAEKGYEVTGIDLSEEAIATAREKAKAHELEHLHFQVRDMRNPLPEKFDAIVNLFTTFGYFLEDGENASVFDSVVHMLESGGLFVIDYLNAQKVRTSFEPSDSGTFQDIKYTISRYLKNDAIYKDIHFKKESTDAEKTYSERVKLYELDWFKKEMSKRHLHIDHVYGDYTGAEFDAAESPRLLIISHLSEA